MIDVPKEQSMRCNIPILKSLTEKKATGIVSLC